MQKKINESITSEIGPIQEKLLFEKSKHIHLNHKDVFVEIGPIFGKATKSIVKGMLLNTKRTLTNKLYVYDSFKYDVNESYAEKILALAKQQNMLDLIQYKPNSWICFEKIFNNNLRSYIDSEDIIVIKGKKLRHKPPIDCSIAFMRINISKRYSDIKSTLFRFLNKTKVSCIIVYDEFFNHWSASIMLTLGFLINRKCLAINESTESSIICQIIRTPNDADLIELDLIMQDTNECMQFFDIIYDECKRLKTKVNESSLHTITLAKIQWLYERKKHIDAKNILVNFFNEKHNLSVLRTLISPYLDLLGNGFSVDRMHKASKRIIMPKTNTEVL